MMRQRETSGVTVTKSMCQLIFRLEEMGFVKATVPFLSKKTVRSGPA